MGSHVFLLVRHRKYELGRTAAYPWLRAADYVSHRGSRPIAIAWRLRKLMPDDFFRKAKLAAGWQADRAQGLRDQARMEGVRLDRADAEVPRTLPTHQPALARPPSQVHVAPVREKGWRCCACAIFLGMPRSQRPSATAAKRTGSSERPAGLKLESGKTEPHAVSESDSKAWLGGRDSNPDTVVQRHAASPISSAQTSILWRDPDQSRSSDRGSSCRTTINPIQTAREARPQRESHHARHT
jgi:hypothetical protein